MLLSLEEWEKVRVRKRRRVYGDKERRAIQEAKTKEIQEKEGI